jgi:sec-independent protein translocase protein TatA
MTVIEAVGFTKNQALFKGYGGWHMMPGPWELILILLIVVMIFGAKRIPEIMSGLGKGIRSFKRSMETDDTPPQPPQAEHQELPKEKAEPK